MSNIFLIVEGVTEEKFYKTFFSMHFPEHNFNVALMPNKRGHLTIKEKGGRVSYDVCAANVKRFIQGSKNCNLIVLIYDFYGLDKTFKSHLEIEKKELALKISSIKQRLEDEINNWRFKFFLQVHEFESYLFSDIEILSNYFKDSDSKDELEKILMKFNNNPELINDSSETAPSKRLAKLYPSFTKTIDGLSIIEKIGIPTVRAKCKHFNELYELIESTESKFKL